ncbi:thiamine pyrophosphate-binding protein [Acuticoccus sediminis]|uniref:thiamine pyrophosphate-binding protein n=1 Tax=Acuticoccus sediminis TaxID=2184697 RepID=UPI001CFE2721|nr:thiamine pyrophosphate-binding protein [Acuticoccus sediminis]
MPFEPLYPTPVPTADAIVDVLVAAGVHYVFGLSGGHTGRIFGALEKRQDAIRTVLVREESLGAVMAETIGRMTGIPGVVLGQGPWILGNGLLGTIEAHLSSSPLLLLTDFSDTPAFSLHAPYQSGTGEYGNWDARQAFGAITKEVFTADAPNAAVVATQLAVKHALAGQPGPVAMIYGIRALDGLAGGDALPKIYPAAPFVAAPALGRPDIGAALALLRGAERPLILAGNGVRIAGAQAALARLAAVTGMPVVTSPSGKGVFDETDAASLGVYGAYGNPSANRAVGSADLILAVGTKMSASDTANADPALIDPRRQTLVQIDIEPRNLSWTFPATAALPGDAADLLGAIADAWDRAPVRSTIAGNVPRTVPLPASDATSGGLHPHEIIAGMQESLPDEAIYTCDAGENRIFMLHYLRSRGVERFIQAAGAGPMGYAIPSALARKLLAPDAPVVAFCGDGGFAMTMNGLITAVEADLPIIVVVMNNDALGWSQHSRGPFATQFARMDYAAIAAGMGCFGASAHDKNELAEAIAGALEATCSGRPAVIDVRTSMDVSFAELSFAKSRALWDAPLPAQELT